MQDAAVIQSCAYPRRIQMEILSMVVRGCDWKWVRTWTARTEERSSIHHGGKRAKLLSKARFFASWRPGAFALNGCAVPRAMISKRRRTSQTAKGNAGQERRPRLISAEIMGIQDRDYMKRRSENDERDSTADRLEGSVDRFLRRNPRFFRYVFIAFGALVVFALILMMVTQ